MVLIFGNIYNNLSAPRLAAPPFALLCFLLLFLCLSASPVRADIQLNNTCSFGNNYLQLAGFACIAAEERLRNPSWSGNWGVQGGYQIAAFELIVSNMNRLGVTINGTTYCANFTVRATWKPENRRKSVQPHRESKISALHLLSVLPCFVACLRPPYLHAHNDILIESLFPSDRALWMRWKHHRRLFRPKRLCHLGCSLRLPLQRLWQCSRGSQHDRGQQQIKDHLRAHLILYAALQMQTGVDGCWSSAPVHC